MSTDPFAATRTRLAELARRLGRLRAQYDLTMNRFEFDEARALALRIAVIEREVDRLGEGLPPLPAAPAVPYAVARRRRPRPR